MILLVGLSYIASSAFRLESRVSPCHILILGQIAVKTGSRETASTATFQLCGPKK